MPSSQSWTASEAKPALPLQQRSFSAPESRRSSHDGWCESAPVSLPAIANCSPRVCKASATSDSSNSTVVISPLILEYRQGPRAAMSVGPDGCLRRATQAATATPMNFVRPGRSTGFRRSDAAPPAPAALAHLTSTFLAPKRGPHAMGSAQRSRALSRAEVGATAFGMPRWEPPMAPAPISGSSSSQTADILIAKAQMLCRQGDRRTGNLLDAIHRGVPSRGPDRPAAVQRSLQMHSVALPERTLASQRRRAALLPTRRS